MSDSPRGEAEITLGGRRLRLRMGSGALIAMQERLSTPDHFLPVLDIFEGSARGRILYTRTILWAALRRYHPDVTEAEIETILDDATVDEVRRMHVVLTGQSMPDPADVRDLAEGTDGRPIKSPAPAPLNGVGIGAGSTSTHVGSASDPTSSGN